MAPKKPQLTVIRGTATTEELKDIRQRNASNHGHVHADAYLAFLQAWLNKLGTACGQGKAVSTRPDLRYIIIRRRAKGHGHIAVHSFDDAEVRILHIFHTAQDWQNKLVIPDDSK